MCKTGAQHRQGAACQLRMQPMSSCLCPSSSEVEDPRPGILSLQVKLVDTVYSIVKFLVPKSHLPERKVRQGEEGHQCQGPEDYEHLQRCPGGAMAREAVPYDL